MIDAVLVVSNLRSPCAKAGECLRDTTPHMSIKSCQTLLASISILHERTESSYNCPKSRPEAHITEPNIDPQRRYKP